MNHLVGDRSRTIITNSYLSTFWELVLIDFCDLICHFLLFFISQVCWIVNFGRVTWNCWVDLPILLPTKLISPNWELVGLLKKPWPLHFTVRSNIKTVLCKPLKSLSTMVVIQIQLAL